MSSEMEATLDLPQLGVRFLLTATAGMWMERQTSKLWGRCSECRASWLLTKFLHSLAYLFQLGYYEPNFKYQIFYFQVYGNLVEENMMYKQLQKFCRKKVCRIKVFGQNILCTPQKLPVPTSMLRWASYFRSTSFSFRQVGPKITPFQDCEEDLKHVKRFKLTRIQIQTCNDDWPESHLESTFAKWKLLPVPYHLHTATDTVSMLLDVQLT